MRSCTGAQTTFAAVVRMHADAVRVASQRPANANGPPPSTV